MSTAEEERLVVENIRGLVQVLELLPLAFDRLVQNNEALRDWQRRAVEVLERMEWTHDSDGFAFCPACGGSGPVMVPGHHAPDCALSAVLRAARGGP